MERDLDADPGGLTSRYAKVSGWLNDWCCRRKSVVCRRYLYVRVASPVIQSLGHRKSRNIVQQLGSPRRGKTQYSARALDIDIFERFVR